MSDVEFVSVTEPEHIAELANLAEEIFREYFPQFLTDDKLDYLSKHLVSTEALTKNIADDDYEYYFANAEGEHIGYVGVALREGYLFLSKLYVRKEQRGQGYGRQAFEFVKSRARAHGVDAIRLTCDRNNKPSLETYDHLGFKVLKSIDTDVGAGYEMNDYLLEWKFE